MNRRLTIFLRLLPRPPKGSDQANPGPAHPARSQPNRPALNLAALGWMAGLLLQAGSQSSWAHGDVHLQIAALTSQIQANPNQPDLHIRRGELYRLHQLWDPALADFEAARSLTTNLVDLDFLLGRLYLEAGWSAAAVTVLDRFLKVQPSHSEGHLLRARARVQLDQPLQAVDDFTKAIQTAGTPSPGYYVERARAEASGGPDHIPQALRGLDEGIKQIGMLVTLQLPAIELELKQKSYDSALQRLDKIAALSPRKETWLKRRGEILQQAGRPDEARKAFTQALEALHALPPARRFVPAMTELEKELLLQLRQPAETPPVGPTPTP